VVATPAVVCHSCLRPPGVGPRVRRGDHPANDCLYSDVSDRERPHRVLEVVKSQRVGYPDPTFRSKDGRGSRLAARTDQKARAPHPASRSSRRRAAATRRPRRSRCRTAVRPR
jgi:hypothetical protein